MALGSVTLLALSTPALAAVHAGPRLLKTTVSFDVPTPAKPATVWTLNLRQHGSLLATTSGSAGTLTLKVPAATHGSVQADVRRNDRWYSGNRFQVSGSGTGGKGGGGKGGGGKGGSGGGGNGSTPPLVVGSTVPITKAAGAGTSLSHGQPTPIALTADPTTPAAPPGAALAFTGTAPALWTLTLGGLILLLAGAYLASRRPTPLRARSLESLLRRPL